MSPTLVILGDHHFTRMVSGEFFKSRVTEPFAVSPVSTMSTFQQLSLTLPDETEFLVIGCLSALITELQPSKVEKRELSLSK